MSNKMTAALTSELEIVLNNRATEFTKLSEHARTLAEYDRWESQAETLRQVAHLVNLNATTTSVAIAFISAAKKLLDAEEAAIHESRSNNRSGATA